jgi:hypothetical protein
MMSNPVNQASKVCLVLSIVVLLILVAPDPAWAPCRQCLQPNSCSSASSGGCGCWVSCGEGGCSCTITCPCANNKCSPCEGVSQHAEASSGTTTEQLAHVRWWGGATVRPLVNDVEKISPTFALLVTNLAAGLRSSPCFARAVLLTGGSGKAGLDDERSATVDWNLTVEGNEGQAVWTFETDSSFENDHSKANRLELRIQKGSASWRLYENESARGSGELRSREITEETAFPPPRGSPGQPRRR